MAIECVAAASDPQERRIRQLEEENEQLKADYAALEAEYEDLIHLVAGAVKNTQKVLHCRYTQNHEGGRYGTVKA